MFPRKNSFPEVIDLPFFRREIGHSKGTRTRLQPRLPVDAEMVLARSKRKKEVRTPLIRSNPHAIHPHLGQGLMNIGSEGVAGFAVWALSQIFDDVDQRFAGLGLGREVARVRFNFELTVFGAASSFGGGEGGLVLSKSGSGEENQNERAFMAFLGTGSAPAEWTGSQIRWRQSYSSGWAQN